MADKADKKSVKEAVTEEDDLVLDDDIEIEDEDDADVDLDDDVLDDEERRRTRSRSTTSPMWPETTATDD